MAKVIDVLRAKQAGMPRAGGGESDCVEVKTIEPSHTVLEAARRMNEQRIGALVVLDKDRTPIGILTERDLLTRVIAAEVSPAETAVGDVMTTRLITCTPDTPLDDLRTIMRRERIRHVPVVKDGELCGMVSIGDLNMVDVKVLSETIRYFEQYIQGSA